MAATLINAIASTQPYLSLQKNGIVTTLSFGGEAGTLYNLETSHDLKSWAVEEAVYSEKVGPQTLYITGNEYEKLFFRLKVVAICPEGYTCIPFAPLTITLNGVPSDGTILGKGQVAGVASYKVQVGPSDLQSNSISLDFDKRIWLYARSITIFDGPTIVAGQLISLGANDFVELSDLSYRITFPANISPLLQASTHHLTVHVEMREIVDQVSTDIGIVRFGVRSTDGQGVSFAQTLVAKRTFSYTAKGNSLPLAIVSEQMIAQAIDNGTAAPIACNIAFGVSVIAGDEDIYISSDPNASITMQISEGTTQTASIVSVNNSVSGDSASSYIIQAGSSRHFTFESVFKNTSGVRGLKTLKVTAINFGSSMTDLHSAEIIMGLEDLQLGIVF